MSTHEHGGGGGGVEKKSGFQKGFEGLIVFLSFIPAFVHIFTSQASLDYYLQKAAEANA